MDEKKRNYLASFNGSYGAERNSNNYQRRDDGSHIYKNDDYYEWWYVDCSFENGYHTAVTLFYMNMFSKPICPSMQIMAYKPDGTRIFRYDVCKPEETYACADWCDLRMKDSWLKDMGNGTYEIYIMINKVGAKLTFRNAVPGWRAGTGFIYNNEDKGKGQVGLCL
jgi:hypothetical protein